MFFICVDAYVLSFKPCVLDANMIFFLEGLDWMSGYGTQFVNMTEQALREFEDEHGVRFDKITEVPSEGDGTIERYVFLPLYMINSSANTQLELDPL